MASGDTGNVVPGNRLRVRISCPPLCKYFAHCAFGHSVGFARFVGVTRFVTRDLRIDVLRINPSEAELLRSNMSEVACGHHTSKQSCP